MTPIKNSVVSSIAPNYAYRTSETFSQINPSIINENGLKISTGNSNGSQSTGCCCTRSDRFPYIYGCDCPGTLKCEPN